jgi:hypothetical protein
MLTEWREGKEKFERGHVGEDQLLRGTQECGIFFKGTQVKASLFVRSVLIVMTYIAFLFSLTRPQGGRTARARFFSSFQNLLKTDSTKQVGIFSFGLLYGYYCQAYPTMPITFWALQVSFQPFQVCLQTTELAWPNDQFHTKTKTRLRQRIFFFFHYYFASRWKCKCIWLCSLVSNLAGFG